MNSDKTKTAKHAHCTSKCSVQTKYHKVLSMESKDNMQFEIKRRQYYFHCIEFVFISVFVCCVMETANNVELGQRKAQRIHCTHLCVCAFVQFSEYKIWTQCVIQRYYSIIC